MPETETPPSHVFTYDVFLNFRGTDTRHGFIGYLREALHDSGLNAFIDDEDLQSGEEIRLKLKKAIEESRIAITVLSEHYASSSFCLEELAYILDCPKGKDRLVLPVFYKVDPSHVRHQKGSYEEALAVHEERFKAEKETESFELNMKKLDKWKKALHQVAELSGCHFKEGDGYEHKFIGKIVEQVFREINHGQASIHLADSPIGLGSQVRQIRERLDVKSDDVHMIGIYGMGGVGKSTLAQTVYNLISNNFDSSCFLQNVREESNKYGLKHLQNIILSQILGKKKKKINLASEQQGTSMIQNRLKGMKVLLILDDVDEHKQIEAIVGNLVSFGPGSRVIITTRDKQLLASHGVKLKSIHEVKGLNKKHALQLLKLKAFKTEGEVGQSYNKVLNDVVTCASGLPLALEVIGSNLFGKSTEEWESAIKQYKRIPKKKIQKILKVSFDALEEEEKSVFLDIACCFKGYKRTEVDDILLAVYGHSMKYHIGVLVDKSLIKINDDDGRVTLHDLIEDMGKEIDRQKSPKEPGERRRLWLPKDIIQVLKDNSGTSEIEIICLDFPRSDKEETVEWNGNAFMGMKNLKALIIRNGIFSQGPNYLPENLRVLEWHKYPSDCLPSDFHTKKLAICKLPDSSFTPLESDDLSEEFINLTVLDT